MSRLQVGGLALIIHSEFEENIGRVVKLVRCLGVIQSIYGSLEHWEHECVGVMRISGLKNGGWHPAKYLLPLGDKKTQDEIRKEELTLEFLNTIWVE